MYLFYNAGLLLAAPFLAGYLLFRFLTGRADRVWAAQRLGFLPATPRRLPVIWFHAVSVGEVMAAEPLVRAVRAAYPSATLLLSTVTATGQATARSRLSEVDGYFYFPFDFPGVVRRVIRKISPDLFIFLETELWPNFLRALFREGVPAILVNGRISPRSYRRYRRVRRFTAGVLSKVALFLVQTDRDAAHLIGLGADPQKVIRTGNLKYDQAAGSALSDSSSVRRELGVAPAERLFVAGSTHEGEERMILSVHKRLVQQTPGLVLLLAPRHLSRLPAVEKEVREAGFVPVRKSEISGGGEEKRVILLDTLGELGRLYAGADLVFIGGSLVPVGGHNLVEAAAHGKVVFFGPHMENFAEASLQAVAAGCGVCAKDLEDLAALLGEWIRSPERLAKAEARAREWVASRLGSVEKNLEWIRRFVRCSG